MKKKNIKISSASYIVLFVLSIGALYTYYVNSPLKQVMTLAISLVAAFSVFYQTKKSTDTAKADFVLSLQRDYINSEGFSEFFNYCWMNYNGNKKYDNIALEKYIQEHREVVLNYLTFFESIYLMKKAKVLDMQLLDELFGRRFYIVVNNKKVQEIDLVKNSLYYTNVYYLYSEWSKYRKKRNNKDNLKQCFLEFDKNSTSNKLLENYSEYKTILNNR